MAGIESILSETRIFPPSESFKKNANVSGMEAYQALCDEAERDYEGFWAKHARESMLWHKPFTQVLDERDAPFYKWFFDGELNVSYNCLDKHLQTQPNKTAIIFEADDGQVTRVSYQQLHQHVCQFANGLKAINIQQGDRVIIYMPMSVEAVVAMQACARIGAIHSVVFGGFSAKSLHERVIDAGAKAIITADEGLRGGKAVRLKDAVDEALNLGGCDTLEKVIVYKRTGNTVHWDAPRDLWWHDLTQGQADTCEPAWVNAEHPLFILYTSGSTGKPKGVQHASAGYLLGAILSMQWVFDYKPTDVYWCTADVGWITGHTYVAYGPLAVGATMLMFEGIPTYPHPGRFWELIQKHKVTTFYTAPTAIRSLIKLGADLPKQYDCPAALIGHGGRADQPEAWTGTTSRGPATLPIVDTWWQPKPAAT